MSLPTISAFYVLMSSRKETAEIAWLYNSIYKNLTFLFELLIMIIALPNVIIDVCICRLSSFSFYVRYQRIVTEE